MNRRALRIVILFALVSTIGIIIGQSYWLMQAMDLKEKQFKHRTTLALQNVSNRLIEASLDSTIRVETIKQLASNYYTVEFNSNINPTLLEEFLVAEFKNNDLNIDFEYGIFECESDSFVVGNYVDMSSLDKIRRVAYNPVTDQNFYFGVLFPKKSGFLANQMKLWLFFTGILFLVITFFGYTIYLMLQQKRFSEVKTDFINNMTHELKTPISTIAVSSEVMMKDNIIEKPDKIKRYASIINEETHRLKNLVDTVLRASIMDENKLNFEQEKFSLDELITKVANNFKLRLTERNGTLEIIQPKQPLIIKGDKTHLNNVVNNMLDNALKYTVKTPEIKVTMRAKKSKAFIEISDNGIGIANKELKNIFEKFYRVTVGDTHNVKGYGIGLYYVKNVIETHNGKIEVASRLNNGTTFSISLPLTKTK